MTKSKKAVSKVVACLAEELEQKFDGLSFSPILEPEDGNDAWLYVYVPPTSALTEDAVRDVARDIELRLWREFSVSIVCMIRKLKEPVHG